MVPLVHRDDLYLLFLTVWIRYFGRGRLEVKIGLLIQKLRSSGMGFLNVVSLHLRIDEIRLMWSQNYFYIWA